MSRTSKLAKKEKFAVKRAKGADHKITPTHNKGASKTEPVHGKKNRQLPSSERKPKVKGK